MRIRKMEKIGNAVWVAGMWVALLAAQPAGAQPPQWWLQGQIHGYYPGRVASISPLELGGEVGLECRELFGTGLSAGLSVGYGWFFLSDSTVNSLSLGTALLSVGYRLPLGPGGSFALYPQAGCGVALAFSDSSNGRSNGMQLIGVLGVRLQMNLGQRLDIELSPAYRLAAETGGLYHGATCGLGLSYRLSSGDSEPARRGEVPSDEQLEQAMALLAAYPSIRIVRSTDRVRLILEGSFHRNQAQLEPAVEEQLQQVAAVIGRLKPRRLLLEGYVAEDQEAATDEAISTARAKAVEDWLARHPLVAEAKPQMEIRGLGRANPVAANTSEDERARNRRVEITLLWAKE